MRAAGYDEAHALIVRPIGGRFQIISGHHRFAAAQVAGLTAVPAWVRDMQDDEAFMALVLCNTHGELTPLERGMHALKSGMTQRAYAEKVGRASTSVATEMQAAKVMAACTNVRADFSPVSLSIIHAAPSWLWPALVSAAHRSGWTVENVRAQLSRVKEVVTPPEWSDIPAIAAAVVDGTLKPRDVAAIVTETESDAHLLELAIDRNAKHGQQLSQNDKRDMARKIYNMTPEGERDATKKRLAVVLSVPERTIREWLSRIDKDTKEARKKRIFELWLGCYTQEEIAKAVTLPQQTVSGLLPDLAELPESVKPYAEHLVDFERPIYNVWKQQEKSAGASHFGNTDVRWVDNLEILPQNFLGSAIAR